MKLRVVIPTLGRSEYLNETLSGARSLARTLDLDVVLVSPAGVSLEHFDLRNVQTVTEPTGFTGGLYGAINLGAAHPGDWTHLTYINDDDGVIGLWERMRDSRADISYGRVLARYVSPNAFAPLSVCAYPRMLPWIWHWGAPGLYQQGTVIARSMFEACGGFDESFRLAADHAFWLKAWRQGATFGFVDEVVAFFRVRPGQLSGNRAQMGEEIERATARYGPRVGLVQRLVGYAYWRQCSVRSAALRFRRGMPLTLQAGK